MGLRQSRPIPKKDLLAELLADTEKQSAVATEPGLEEKKDNESHIYRHIGFEDKLAVCMKSKEEIKPAGSGGKKARRKSSSGHDVRRRASSVHTAEVKDLISLWNESVAAHKDHDFIGKRVKNKDGSLGEFEFKTYGEIDVAVQKLAKCILSLGYEKGDRIGCYSSNRMEYTITYLAVYTAGLVLVPVYDTLGENAVKYVLNHADCRAVFVEGNKVKNVTAVKDEIKTLEKIIIFDEEYCKDVPDSVSFEAFMNPEKVPDFDYPKIDPTQLAIIMYTSGTTGDPKGVMLSHRNIIASVAGATSAVELSGDDSYLSYLPLAHIFETICQMLTIAAGAKIGYFSGNIKLLTADAKVLQPTLFIGVPRVYQRIHQVVNSTLAKKNWIARKVIGKAVREQTIAVNEGRERIAKWDKKVFSKVKMALGGRVRMFVSGAAPLAPYLADFLNIFFGAPLLEGYGMTETAAILCVSSPDDHTLGHVGPPLAHVELKFQDVPEMNYRHTDEHPRGEIMARGAGIFSGYFKMPEKTAETIDPDGWMHTGDIGRLNPNGTVTIIDRKKNIFKLAQGEYVAIEKVEAAYQKAGLVGQLWGYGNSFETILVAVCVPDIEYLRDMAKKGGWSKSDQDGLYPTSGPVSRPTGTFPKGVEACVKNHYDEIKATMLAQMEEEAKAAKLKGFEKIRDIFVEGRVNDLAQGLSVDNDCLTPTFKLKRPMALKRYQSEIDEMYKKAKDAEAARAK